MILYFFPGFSWLEHLRMELGIHAKIRQVGSADDFPSPHGAPTWELNPIHNF